MSDTQRQTQLDNIQAASGMSVAEFGQAVQRAELERHGEIVAFLKREYGLTHGNANLIAHVVREELAGGPAAPDDLLEAQYAGAKSGLRPIYDALLATAEGLGQTSLWWSRRPASAFAAASSSPSYGQPPLCECSWASISRPRHPTSA